MDFIFVKVNFGSKFEENADIIEVAELISYMKIDHSTENFDIKRNKLKYKFPNTKCSLEKNDRRFNKTDDVLFANVYNDDISTRLSELMAQHKIVIVHSKKEKNFLENYINHPLDTEIFTLESLFDKHNSAINVTSESDWGYDTTDNEYNRN